MRAAVQALVLVALAPNAFAGAPRTLITVVTADGSATTGELRRWARDGGGWRAIGAPIAVVVGRSGLKATADKREGDGASPAGRFALGDATGYDAAPPPTRLRYRVATPELRCVDDPQSPLYNQIAVADVGEKMRRDDELYRFTIFVRHNERRTPGAGSCIFLHVWRDARSPTVGCTAMALDDLRALLRWVDRSTLLVQLPRAEYEARQREWGLPPLVAQRK
ncbi:MAG TPA: L,D-transpeptidase family protein [Polyangia bacterium]